MHTIKTKIAVWITGILCFAGWFSTVYSGTIEKKMKEKYFFGEDGTLTREVVIDTIPEKADSMPPELSLTLKKRKKQISDFFEGKLVMAKISLPASHRGIVLYEDNISKSNVDIFKSVDKYGASIEKYQTAMITKFTVQKRGIDIQLNNGGYGSPVDLFWRGTAGIFTLGITEFTGVFSKVRYERGSRVRVKFMHNLKAEQLDLDKIKGYIAQVLEVKDEE